MMLGIPSPQKVIHSLKPAQASCTPPGFVLFVAQFLHTLGRAIYPLPPSWSGWLRRTLLSTSYYRESCLFNLTTAWYSCVSQPEATLQYHLYRDEVHLSWWKLVVIPYILPRDNIFFSAHLLWAFFSCEGVLVGHNTLPYLPMWAVVIAAYK